MSKLKRVSSPIYTFFPTEVEGFASLGELALDMRWSWNRPYSVATMMVGF